MFYFRCTTAAIQPDHSAQHAGARRGAVRLPRRVHPPLPVAADAGAELLPHAPHGQEHVHRALQGQCRYAAPWCAPLLLLLPGKLPRWNLGMHFLYLYYVVLCRKCL